jgi:hypothetical protein
LKSDPVERHSRLGIASFIIALSVGGLVFLLIPASIAATTVTQRGSSSAALPIAVGMGLAVILAYCGNLTGVGLGIAGVRQRERKKLFAIIGLCMNAAGAIVGTLFVVAGLMLRPAPPTHRPNDERQEMPNTILEPSSNSADAV